LKRCFLISYLPKILHKQNCVFYKDNSLLLKDLNNYTRMTMGGRSAPPIPKMPPPPPPPAKMDTPEIAQAELDMENEADTDTKTAGKNRKYRVKAKGKGKSKSHSNYKGGGLSGYTQSKSGNA
jgi:hypothetical protein